MGKKSRNKKVYKRVLPKMVKFENERIRQVLGLIPTPDENKFSFRKYFQERNTKQDLEMSEMADICTVRDGMEVITEIRAKKGVPFQTPVAEQKDVIADYQPQNLKRNQFPVWMSTRKQKKIIKKNRKIRKIKLNKMKEVLKNKREVMKLKKKGKKR